MLPSPAASRAVSYAFPGHDTLPRQNGGTGEQVKRRRRSNITCSPAHLFSCSPALLLTCSPALLLTCSPVLLLTCSSISARSTVCGRKTSAADPRLRTTNLRAHALMFATDNPAQQLPPLYSDLGADPDLGDLVGLFVEEMPERIASLLRHQHAGDWENLRRTAHQIKGAAGSYGFGPISPLAGRLEEFITRHEPEVRIQAALSELVALCRRASAGVERRRNDQ